MADQLQKALIVIGYQSDQAGSMAAVQLYSTRP